MFLLNFIPSPTWRDVIDVLFLTIVAYQLYVWFRGTRALRVLIGLVVLGGVYSLARMWGLFLTTWVFQIFWQVLLILLLILFQSEIRQVLEKVSPLRFLKSRKRIFRGALAKELADVAFELAKEKTGALVVITRDDDPAEFLHAGQNIMALPDPILIKSIFNHHSPAHDGALILADGRLTRMGCILPLSEKEDLPEQYGTRHRAALGLSEQIDSVCLVVSEERGEVSTIVGGKITTWETPGSLAAKLKDWLSLPEIHGPTFKGFFKGAFIQNWGPKSGALALITMAWLILASQQVIKTSVIAPVRYTNLSKELVLDRDSTQMVNLTLSGRRKSIKALENREVQVHFDIGVFSAGTHQISLSAKNIDLPLGVMIDRVTPQDIKIILKKPHGGGRDIPM
ncbi:MAG: DNA integrity scanning protein DisA nucleotide-binding domain protein [Deltaproteobacteria bacterium]|nr:DNA integrity scanning protein DisA nucleotide-binding domain protein [Deltaproteobacteria bacterium]MBW2118047.1 DNA integrity scanning protein DisA nucleotide-binding domain protein [Deltaproteobacteria bacterium]MBW2343215.1 DNA integrity scanning protein DisA nucleotide-binding domain protein [Deltaproteobacteria bacterium]